MADFEKLGLFYLGRPWDLARKAPREGLVLYDSKDLVTHAVCVGMTGSGKTGLCLCLLEEAAIDGIPAIVIDPKGDLGNLLLTFPELRPEDFAPWVDLDEARRKGLTPEALARQQAELWAKGLRAWGQDGARIRRLREAVDIAIYTPGSTAGLPVSILRSFEAPGAGFGHDEEALRERVQTTVTSLLGLLGIEADPIRSREHILLSTILDASWREGRDLDLGTLIQAIQSPPVQRVGVLDLEAFYPAKARFELAMAVNNLLAAPGFAAWMEGEPLDVGRLLHTPAGRPRIAILSIAHLADAERMFFVAMLLNQVVSWMRQQPGTTSLRAIVYMDEIFGYFPPVANPPSKPPLLTLLKQARAYGVGVVLATQNPVDLDYKGLANAGTWFIGRLQTERDRARLLDGLEGAAAAAGSRLDRRQMEATLAALGQRIFLMSNVHDAGPEVFETRWALSYLRGPLTRAQIRTLMDPVRVGQPGAPAARPDAGAVDAAPTATGAGPSAVAARPPAPALAARPVLPPEIPQHFVPLRGARPARAGLLYRPMLLGAAQVQYREARCGIDATEDVTVLTPVTTEAVAVDWERAEEAAVALADLEAAPADGAAFAPLPPAAQAAKAHDAWRRDLAAWLHRTRALRLLRHPGLGLCSAVGEAEGEFRARLRHAAHERRDAATEALRRTYGPRLATLEERLRRAEQAVARESEQARSQTLQTAISLGATLLGAFMGRKAVSASTLGRATTAARGAGRAMKEYQDIGRARETVEALRQQLADLEAEFQAQAERLAGATADRDALEEVVLRPTRQGVAVRLVTLAWTPWWQGPGGETLPAWR